MGCISFLCRLSFYFYILFTLLVGYLIYGPNQLDIEPIAFKIDLYKDFTGPLTNNNLLDKATILFENVLIGPESLALHKGSIYTGLHTGEIVKITDDKKYTKIAQIGKPCEGQWTPEVCGRTLGIRINKNGQLYAVDAYYGLYTVDLQSGVKKAILPMTQEIEGFKMKFPDDMDVDENGVVYLSDASTKWGLEDIVYPCLEYDNRGRIIKYDPKTSKASVIMKGLHFPNGVQISHDRKTLLVAELLKERILKYHLEGPKKGQVDVFTNLPGQPDNIRPSSRGGYWIGMAMARDSATPILLDYFNEYPIVRKVVSRLFYGAGSLLQYLSKLYPDPILKDLAFKLQKAWPLMNLNGKKAMVIELDSNGKIIRTLQSDNQKYMLVSEVLEHNGHLYLGSFINPYLTKVKL